MAIEFTCTSCGKITARSCNCHNENKRSYPYVKSQKEKIEDSRLQADRALRNLRNFVRENSV